MTERRHTLMRAFDNPIGTLQAFFIPRSSTLAAHLPRPVSTDQLADFLQKCHHLAWPGTRGCKDCENGVLKLKVLWSTKAQSKASHINAGMYFAFAWPRGQHPLSHKPESSGINTAWRAKCRCRHGCTSKIRPLAQSNGCKQMS